MFHKAHLHMNFVSHLDPHPPTLVIPSINVISVIVLGYLNL